MRGRKHTPEGHFSTENQRRPGSSGGHLGGICVDPCPLSELLGRNRGSKTHRPFVGAPYGGQAREVPWQLECTESRCFWIPHISVPRDRLTLAAIWGSDKRAVSYLAADSSRFFEICRFSPDQSAKVVELPAALHEGFLALFCLHTPFRQSTPPHGANSHSGPDEPWSGKSRSEL